MRHLLVAEMLHLEVLVFLCLAYFRGRSFMALCALTPLGTRGRTRAATTGKERRTNGLGNPFSRNFMDDDRARLFGSSSFLSICAWGPRPAVQVAVWVSSPLRFFPNSGFQTGGTRGRRRNPIYRIYLPPICMRGFSLSDRNSPVARSLR